MTKRQYKFFQFKKAKQALVNSYRTKYFGVLHVTMSVNSTHALGARHALGAIRKAIAQLQELKHPEPINCWIPEEDRRIIEQRKEDGGSYTLPLNVSGATR